MKAIEAVKLRKSYGSINAVNGLSFSVEQGSLYALLGVNGAGKSTAIRMLCGLERPDEGEVFLMGSGMEREAARLRRMVGISPQESAVAPRLSVRENLELMAQLYGASFVKARQSAAEMLSRFGLEQASEQRAGTLSGGQQRRLSIAMAMITEPQVLFLDEPTLGLDVVSRRTLWNIIGKMKEKTTVLLTTHYMEEAEALSDCIGVLCKGRLVAQGTAQELILKTGARNFEEAFVALAAPEEVYAP